ncbi:uncharacterized protein LOC119546797 [Drosophila subpulchrella]|uniref:uncharacterized protein LOC119546797 n=1 Tax=Drosophila subpulchrella TaxID=1486046 RepID=UPI0018A17CB0|nr:uncharacterized protein LOC119546797 [Drosophila subpulchrella]XP_037709300.1 uncharacterized protein LOC119546797 [Drosophila subpulchrella]XP_037709301.1 uncharacterized protein LOC119546797 [Drosophila subpulchrella]
MSWPKQWGYASLWLPLLIGLLYTQNASAFIVPRELPSILSIVYSNIPPIKKGTDSRLGFGFRLGEHADFQVMVELGPQKETRPIGDPNQNDQSFNKRQVSQGDQKALARLLYRQQVKEEAQRLMTSTERNGASWLETWSNGMKPQKPKGQKDQAKRPVVKESSQDPSNAMQQLQLLYKMATSSSTTSSTTTTEIPPVFQGGSLNLGGPSGFKLPPPALSQDTNTLSNPDPPKSPSEITKELMNVSLETDT